MKIVYLYGFASGPLSDKAQFFKKKFKSIGVDCQIYDYLPNVYEFKNMKISQLHKNLHSYLTENYGDEKIILFGSSFGGLLVTMYTHFHPDKVDQLILIAPALQFTPEFIAKTLGTTISEWNLQEKIYVDHYRFNRKIPLKSSLLTDLQKNPVPEFSMNDFPIHTIIFHGNQDETVPPDWSTDFASSNPNVKAHILNGDHQLLDQKERMWNEIKSELKIK